MGRAGRHGTNGSTTDERVGRRLALAVVAAVVLHVVVLTPAGWLLPDGATGGAPRRSLSVELYEWQRRYVAPFQYEPPVPIPEGQAVDAPPVAGADPHASEDARYLAEQAQTVERETQATIRIAGPHRPGSRIAAPTPRNGRRPSVGVLATPGEPGPGAGDRSAPFGEFSIFAPPGAAPAPANVLAEDGERAASTADGRSPTPAPQSPRTHGDDGAFPLPPGDALAPGIEVLSQAVAGSGLDHLEGAELGDATALSTRPFAHAGFYRRVRDRVAQFWDVRGAFDLHDPQGSIYGYRDRETLVLVTLDCIGELVSTILLEESGARFLDELAVDSIAQAAPFHNPPRELCDRRRDIITFTFGFYVETDQGPTLRVRMGR
ncbi:MAG: hypothetical protein JXB32_00575 [Deltaproteobacteria bacterium]|nr:hypothetical protein [Deltaproteobacteria bacterium]